MSDIARVILSKSLLTPIGSGLIGFGLVAPLLTWREPTATQAWCACLGVLLLAFRIIFHKELPT